MLRLAGSFVGRLGTGDPLLDSDLRDLEVVQTEAGTFLLASTGQNGGISVYSLQNSRAVAVDSAHFQSSGLGIGEILAVTFDGRLEIPPDGAEVRQMLRY